MTSDIYVGGNIVIKDIQNGGMGGDAEVIVQVRNLFPGVGGCITTKQAAYVALRKELKSANVAGTGHKTFLRHLLIKKLDDFFCRAKVYLGPHVTRPFGSIGILDTGLEVFEASIYEWAWGQDGFPWQIRDGKGSNLPIMLEEWGLFNSVFHSVGIDMGGDVSNADNGNVSQNIIHQLYSYNDVGDCRLNLCWHRIDFGSDSILINYEKLGYFLKEKSESLEELLGVYRYELLGLVYRALSPDIEMSERESGRMDILVREFRKSSLRHLSPEVIL